MPSADGEGTKLQFSPKIGRWMFAINRQAQWHTRTICGTNRCPNHIPSHRLNPVYKMRTIHSPLGRRLYKAMLQLLTPLILLTILVANYEAVSHDTIKNLHVQKKAMPLIENDAMVLINRMKRSTAATAAGNALKMPYKALKINAKPAQKQRKPSQTKAKQAKAIYAALKKNQQPRKTVNKQ
uniref:Uncharacterized protein n=1 Tax=Globodera rostochiensis TaxID=31243 RepID=A0A914HQB0_GLORO